MHAFKLHVADIVVGKTAIPMQKHQAKLLSRVGPSDMLEFTLCARGPASWPWHMSEVNLRPVSAAAASRAVSGEEVTDEEHSEAAEQQPSHPALLAGIQS